MNGLPYYKAYPRDFIEGTVGMPFELKGAYRLLLDLIYMHGGDLPDEPRYISGLLGMSVRKWKDVRDRLIEAGKITSKGTSISNERADKELEISRLSRDKQRENRIGSRKNNGLQKPNQNHTDTDTDISVTDVTDITPKPPSTQVARSNAKTAKRDIDEAFEAWWRIYPRRVAKTAARKAYTRIITKGEASHEDLAAGAARFADAVAGSEARFIAHPATWLNAGRWLDEPDPAAGGGTRNDQHSRVGEVLRGIALFDRLPRADVG